MLRDKNAPIGIFDSGAGGISVLGRAVNLLPRENYIYYADRARFPYGDKTTATVKEGVFAAAEEMAARGIKMLVVACNTATAAAIEDLRSHFDFPILGVEPALKPAVEQAHSGKVAVLATSLTLREKKFQHLFETYAQKGEILNLPAPGLADLVEQGHYNDDEGRRYLQKLFQGVTADTVVLGCTHYLFLLPLLRELLPQAAVIDGGEGLARNMLRTLHEEAMENEEGSGEITVLASDDGEFSRAFPVFFRDIQSILAQLPHSIS